MRIREDAAHIGPATADLCEQILEQRPHPEPGFHACLGIVRLELSLGALDPRPQARSPRRTKTPRRHIPILYPNIRGQHYYH